MVFKKIMGPWHWFKEVLRHRLCQGLSNRISILEKENEQLKLYLAEEEDRATLLQSLFLEAQDECIELKRDMEKIRNLTKSMSTD